MRIAVISDIHGNLEALRAVLSDIRARGADEIYCLGDVVGYGPNPRECLDLVMEWCQVVVLGNHDQGAIFDPKGFNGVSERAIFWTSAQLEAPIPSTTVVFGEIGLAGEVRAVDMARQRVAEASKFGFTKCILPKTCAADVRDMSVELAPVTGVARAIDLALDR